MGGEEDGGVNDNQWEDFNEYQEIAHSTAQYPDDAALVYTALGLASEAGEYAGKVKKIIRDSGGVMTPAAAVALIDELSDVAWYLAESATVLGVPLSAVVRRNAEKLADRAKRGVIKGSGDTR